MDVNNSVSAWVNDIAHRADIFPHQIDLLQDKLLLVNLTVEECKKASFLDQRCLTPSTKGLWVPWSAVADAILPEGSTPNYIFHVGHCGSTLLSRLLDCAAGTICLREPLPLRTLAQDMADVKDGRSFLSVEEQLLRLDILTKLWGRSDENVIIKATSICTDLMPHMLRHRVDAKAVFIYNNPQTHLETLLAGQGSLTSLKGFSQLRIQRLRNITGLDLKLECLNIGELAALSWLSETTRITEAMVTLSSQVLLVDFDVMLASQEKTLAKIFEHLNISVSAELVSGALNSSVMHTYSKAPDYQFNSTTRAVKLAEARVSYKAEITAGLIWIESLAKHSPLVARTLELFENNNK